MTNRQHYLKFGEIYEKETIEEHYMEEAIRQAKKAAAFKRSADRLRDRA